MIPWPEKLVKTLPGSMRSRYERNFLVTWSNTGFGIGAYCTISFNSAGLMIRYGQAEILLSALSEFCRDKARNSAVQRRRPSKFATVITKTVSALEKIAVTFRQF